MRATVYSPRGRFSTVDLREPRGFGGMHTLEPNKLARALAELRCPLNRVVTDTTFQVRDRDGHAIATIYQE